MSTIRIAAEALQTIRSEAQRSVDGRETGGILLGYDSSGTAETLVMQAGGPGPKAERRPDFFLRDREYADRLADDAWLATRSRWIGDWHTHPTALTSPSRLDLASYATLLSDTELGFASFISLIVGADDRDWTVLRLIPWQISLRRLRFARWQVHVAQLQLGLASNRTSDLAATDHTTIDRVLSRGIDRTLPLPGLGR